MSTPEAAASPDYEGELPEDFEGEQPEESKPKRGPGRWLLLLVLLGGLGAGGWYAWQMFATGEQGTEAVTERPGSRNNASYLPLDPPLVVNFSGSGQLRYLQVAVEVMAPDAKGVESIRRHTPAIRNSLITLFSERDYESLLTRAGKEALREEALAAIRAELTALTGQAVAEDVYFTSFVMQ